MMQFALPKKVEVKQNHISKGYQWSAFYCPVALAFTETLKWNHDNPNEYPRTVAVSTRYITFYKGSNAKSINIHPKLKSWMANYDAVGKPKNSKPITITLRENQSCTFYSLEE